MERRNFVLKSIIILSIIINERVIAQGGQNAEIMLTVNTVQLITNNDVEKWTKLSDNTGGNYIGGSTVKSWETPVWNNKSVLWAGQPENPNLKHTVDIVEIRKTSAKRVLKCKQWGKNCKRHTGATKVSSQVRAVQSRGKIQRYSIYFVIKDENGNILGRNRYVLDPKIKAQY